MNIFDAISSLKGKKTEILMAFANVTIDEFAKHAFLDSCLTPGKYGLRIGYVGKRNKDWGDYEIQLDHGQNDELNHGVGISFRPILAKHKKFVLSVRDRFGSEKTWIYPYDKEPDKKMKELFDYASMAKGLWDDADKIGHKEIADLARFFDQEFVKKHRKGFETRLTSEYCGLTYELIEKMQYRPETVASINYVGEENGRPVICSL